MLIIEAIARTKFCPHGRGAAPIGNGKYASGVNMAPQGALTTCQGNGCMFWESQGEVKEHQPDGECATCQGGESMSSCKACAGTGKKFKEVKHELGFCGGAYQGPQTVALNELTLALQQHTAAVTWKPMPLAPGQRFHMAGRAAPAKPSWWARLRASLNPTARS